MAIRCEHGFLFGLCVQPRCSHYDNGKVPRIEQTGVQVANRRPARRARRDAERSVDDVVAALDRADTLREAAQKLGCSIQAFYMRARHSDAVREALQRRRERGHVRGRKRRPCSPMTESKAQVIERVRVGRTDVGSSPAKAADTRERDLANLARLQQSRPLAPPGRAS